MTLEDKIRAAILADTQWSPAERRHMGAIIEEIMHYVRTGEGNTFIREWSKRHLVHLF